MHFRQKLIFMALGCALTLAGYLLATVVSEVTAQDNKTESLGDVVCDSITIHDGDITIFKEGRLRSHIDSNTINFSDISGDPRVIMGYLDPEYFRSVPQFEHDIPDSDLDGGYFGFANKGKMRLGIQDSKIRLFDKSGNARVVMHYYEPTDAGSIVMLDKSRNYRVGIYEDAGLAFSHRNTLRIAMGIGETNASSLEFLDKSGKYGRVRIGVGSETDDGWIATYDRNGDLRGYLHKH